LGRIVNFTLNSADVIHSFWIPALNGKRDVIPRRTNYLWFSPDSAGGSAWNGACAEFCGTSHANMRFKTFTVSQADFESWAKHQAEAATAPPGVPAPAAPPATTPGTPAATTPAQGAGKTAAKTANAAQIAAKAAADSAQAANATPVVQAGFM